MTPLPQKVLALLVCTTPRAPVRLPRIRCLFLLTGLFPGKNIPLVVASLSPLRPLVTVLVNIELTGNFPLVSPTVGLTNRRTGCAFYPLRVALNFPNALGILIVALLAECLVNGTGPLPLLRNTLGVVFVGVCLWSPTTSALPAPLLQITTKLFLLTLDTTGLIIPRVNRIVIVVLTVPLLPPKILVLTPDVSGRVEVITLLPLILIRSQLLQLLLGPGPPVRLAKGTALVISKTSKSTRISVPKISSTPTSS